MRNWLQQLQHGLVSWEAAKPFVLIVRTQWKHAGNGSSANFTASDFLFLPTHKTKMYGEKKKTNRLEDKINDWTTRAFLPHQSKWRLIDEPMVTVSFSLLSEETEAGFLFLGSNISWILLSRLEFFITIYYSIFFFRYNLEPHKGQN